MVFKKTYESSLFIIIPFSKGIPVAWFLERVWIPFCAEAFLHEAVRDKEQRSLVFYTQVWCPIGMRQPKGIKVTHTFKAMNTREEGNLAFGANGGKDRVNTMDPFLKRSSVMSPLRFDKNKIYIRIFVIRAMKILLSPALHRLICQYRTGVIPPRRNVRGSFPLT